MNERQIKIDIGYAVEVMLRRIAGSSWCYCHEIVDLLSVCGSGVDREDESANHLYLDTSSQGPLLEHPSG